jgi:hypothetical protein
MRQSGLIEDSIFMSIKRKGFMFAKSKKDVGKKLSKYKTLLEDIDNKTVQLDNFWDSFDKTFLSAAGRMKGKKVVHTWIEQNVLPLKKREDVIYQIEKAINEISKIFDPNDKNVIGPIKEFEKRLRHNRKQIKEERIKMNKVVKTQVKATAELRRWKVIKRLAKNGGIKSPEKKYPQGTTRDLVEIIVKGIFKDYIKKNDDWIPPRATKKGKYVDSNFLPNDVSYIVEQTPKGLKFGAVLKYDKIPRTDGKLSSIYILLTQAFVDPVANKRAGKKTAQVSGDPTQVFMGMDTIMPKSLKLKTYVVKGPKQVRDGLAYLGNKYNLALWPLRIKGKGNKQITIDDKRIQTLINQSNKKAAEGGKLLRLISNEKQVKLEKNGTVIKILVPKKMLMKMKNFRQCFDDASKFKGDDICREFIISTLMADVADIMGKRKKGKNVRIYDIDTQKSVLLEDFKETSTNISVRFKMLPIEPDSEEEMTELERKIEEDKPKTRKKRISKKQKEYMKDLKKVFEEAKDEDIVDLTDDVVQKDFDDFLKEDNTSTEY